MSDVDAILELANSLDPEVKFTKETCEDLVRVPAMFRKMALKSIIKAAKEEGVKEVTAEFARKFKP